MKADLSAMPDPMYDSMHDPMHDPMYDAMHNPMYDAMDGRHAWMDAMHGWTSWMDGRMPCDAPYGHLPYSFIAYHTQYYVVPTHASSDRVLIGDCWVLAIR